MPEGESDLPNLVEAVNSIQDEEDTTEVELEDQCDDCESQLVLTTDPNRNNVMAVVCPGCLERRKDVHPGVLICDLCSHTVDRSGASQTCPECTLGKLQDPEEVEA